MTLSDSSTCKAGASYQCNKNFDIKETTKICKIDVWILNDESCILEIIFYDDKNNIIKKLGSEYEQLRGRKETFLIAENERLIGCELEYDTNNLWGITFLKWEI